MGDRTILVVDDDDEIREIVALSLEVMGGWSVLTADRGGSGLEMARKHLPDVVLLDVMMPEMDGPTMFSRMQVDPALRGIPVVLLTAKVQVGHVQVWDSLPVAGVIPKPFNPATLSTQIDDLVAEHKRSTPPGFTQHPSSA
jgi:CheY-like chemotaxis protein